MPIDRNNKNNNKSFGFYLFCLLVFLILLGAAILLLPVWKEFKNQEKFNFAFDVVEFYLGKRTVFLCGNNEVVIYSLFGVLRSGFSCEGCLCRLLARSCSLRESRCFMHEHTNSVSETMTEFALISLRVYYIARRRVCRLTFNALTNNIKRGTLCRKHGIVKMFHIVIGFPYDNCTRHIRAVSVNTRAEIHSQKSALKRNISRYSVGTGGSRT